MALDVNGFARGIKKAVNAKSSKSDLPINLRDYCVGDGVADDSAGLRAAVAAARNGRTVLRSRGLFLPIEMQLLITETVDLRHIVDLDLRGLVRVGPNGMLIVGSSSTQRPGQRIYIRDVSHVDAGTQSNVAVRAMGMKQAEMTIQRCSYLELLADTRTDAVAEGSISYSNFYLGQVRRLAIRGLGGPLAWITECNFIGGDIKDLVIEGEYGHNNLTWLKPCFESGVVDIKCGHRNHFIDARCEAGTIVKFAAQTSRNFFEDNYLTTTTSRNPSAVVEDAGFENVVIGTLDRYTQPTTIATLNPTSQIFDKSRDTAGDSLIPGLEKLACPRWAYALDTGKFSVRESLPGYAGNLYETAWKLLRLQFNSDVKSWRPTVTLYDASGNTVTTPGALATAGIFSVSGQDWLTLTDVESANIIILDPSVTHARIRIRASGTEKPFRTIQLVAYSILPSNTVGPDILRDSIKRPLYQATKPTSGMAYPGTVVQGPSGPWRATFRLDTTTAAPALSGELVVSVASAAGVAVGDVIGVALADGLFTHWASVAAVSGSSVTLSAALPQDVPFGKPVGVVRWT